MGVTQGLDIISINYYNVIIFMETFNYEFSILFLTAAIPTYTPLLSVPLAINILIVSYCTLICFINSTNIFIYVFKLVYSIEIYIIEAQFYVICNIWNFFTNSDHLIHDDVVLLYQYCFPCWRMNGSKKLHASAWTATSYVLRNSIPQHVHKIRHVKKFHTSAWTQNKAC
jgi:hypothetical protein